MRRGLILLLLLLVPTLASAQTITGQILRVYAEGSITPFSDTTITGQVCNLDPALMPPAAEVQNPREAWWDDPVNANRVCRWTDTGAGPLLALPVGGQRYNATLRFVNPDGQSGPESPRSNPFWKPHPLPAAPVRVIIGSGSPGN